MFKKKTLWLLFCFFILSPLITSTLSTSAINAGSQKPFRISATITVPGNYSTIQEAINAASPGDTIFVGNGIYHEHVEVNKTITLIGENRASTIIDGDGVPSIPIVLVTKPNVVMSNITVRNTASDTLTYGVLVSNTQNVSLVNMTVADTYRAVVLYNASYNWVLDNQIGRNYATGDYGITLFLSSNYNNFSGNTIIGNPAGAFLQSSAQSNVFYHNNFQNNTVQVDTTNYGTGTKWNVSYPTGGNYWSDYVGVDLNSGPNQDQPDPDGIGDTPYSNGGALDYLPLMKPWGQHPIADFVYSPATPRVNEMITFDASTSYDPDGNITSYKWDFGDSNVTTISTSTITHAYANQGNYSVTLTVTDNSTLTDSTTKTISVRAVASRLTMQVSSTKVENLKTVTISGDLVVREQPPGKAENIIINYTRQEQIDWKILAQMTTDISGAYQYVWNATTAGVFLLMSIWEGNLTTNPAFSQVITVNVTKKLSMLTITANPTTVTVGSDITITGKLTPTRQGENVTISYGYLTVNGWTWKPLTTAQTDSSSNYHYNWTTTEPGSFFILNATWLGDEYTYRAQNLTGSINITKIASNITISVDIENVAVGSSISINGKITPTRVDAHVTILIRATNGTVIGNFTVQTDATGNYEYSWTATNSGTYQIRASWRGDNITMSAESRTLTVNAESASQVSPIVYYAAGVILLIAAVVIVWKLKKK